MDTKPGVLIIEGHVQGLSNVRALGEHGIPVWVIDKSDCVARYSKYCQNFFICPDYDSDSFIAFLIHFSEQHQLNNWLLLPSNDHAVYNISKNKENLSAHFKLITENLETVLKIYDKVELLKIAQEIGVNYPLYETYNNLSECKASQLTFPLITKGNNGLSFYKKTKTKVLLSNSLEELENNLKNLESKIPLKETFTQEILPYSEENKTISFTCFSINGEIKAHWIGVKLREHPLRFGTATLAESIEKKELYLPSQKLMQTLNYTGICEIEYLLDIRDKKYKLIEINARTWLWVGLAKACGVNYAKLAYDFVNGVTIKESKNYEIGTVWFNPITNVFFGIKGLLLGRVKLKSIFENIPKKKINALFQKGDRKPGFMYFVLLFKIFKTR
jgi:predicted ATP-grasp superfamily ATP-dependent carboligase